MRDENQAKAHLPGVTILTSPSHSPYNFEITITEKLKTLECIFQVAGKDPITFKTKKCVYKLPDRSHCAYVDFFAQLSNDFGLRVPQNRRPPAKHSRKIAYSEILDQNLVPGMLFGYGDPSVIRLESNRNKNLYIIWWSHQMMRLTRSPNFAVQTLKTGSLQGLYFRPERSPNSSLTQSGGCLL